MEDKLIDKTAKQYNKYSLWLTAGLTLIVLMSISLNLITTDITIALAVSVIYTVVVNFAYGGLWKRVAKSAPNTLAKFYMAASMVRLIIAAIVIFSFCMLSQNKTDIRNFILLFFVFYLVMLVFDSVFFARTEKNNNLKTEK